MDRRIVGVGALFVAGWAAVVVMDPVEVGVYEDPTEVVEVVDAPQAAPSGGPEAAAAVPDEERLPGVPTAAEQAEIEAARAAAAARPLTLQELVAGKTPAERKEADAFRPPVGDRKNIMAHRMNLEGPLPADVVGVEEMFLQRATKVSECMRWNAPKKDHGEDGVTVLVRIEPEGDHGAITNLTAPADTERRYDAFLTCLQTVVSDVPFRAPTREAAEVSWVLRR